MDSRRLQQTHLVHTHWNPHKSVRSSVHLVYEPCWTHLYLLGWTLVAVTDPSCVIEYHPYFRVQERALGYLRLRSSGR